MAVPFATLGSRRVSEEDHCYIIAEIGVNHNGDVDLAHRMIDVAKAAGADAVKFQTFRTDDLVTAAAPKASYQSETTGSGNQAEMLRRLELPVEAYAALRNHCLSVAVDFMSTAEPPHLNWSTVMFRRRRTRNGEQAAQARGNSSEAAAG